MNYTIFVPSAVASGKDARRLLEKALELGLEPTPHSAHTANLRKLSLYLPATLTAQIDAHPSSLSRSNIIRGLVSAAADQSNRKASAAAAPGIQVAESRKWNQHRAQQEMVDTMMKGIRAKKIVILEGSTGIGKSKVLPKPLCDFPPVQRSGSSPQPSRSCINCLRSS